VNLAYLCLSSRAATTSEYSTIFQPSKKLDDAMHGVLYVKFRYAMAASRWRQFAHDVVLAFRHPIFGAMTRLNDTEKVRPIPDALRLFCQELLSV